MFCDNCGIEIKKVSKFSEVVLGTNYKVFKEGYFCLDCAEERLRNKSRGVKQNE